jgi:hypothetical protein
MNRLGFPTRISSRILLAAQLLALVLMAHNCGNPGRCGWACTDDEGCASDYTCVDGMCWNTECDEERPGHPTPGPVALELCGNGVVDGNEECDGDDMTQCLSTQECYNCQCVYSVTAPTCGNGTVEGNEECDGDNLAMCLSIQECHNCQCVYMVGCGNGIVEGNEECDGSDMTQCLSTQECHNCQCVYMVEAATCGNGVVDGGEECDGNDMTQCLSTQECFNCQCVYMVGCGNGIVEWNEECDGNDLTQCLSTQECFNCQCVYMVEAATCGNGVVDGDEECDGNDMTQCLSTQECHNCQCVYMVEAPTCGNGQLDAGESCEPTDLAPVCMPGHACVNCQCVELFGCGDGYCDTATENTDLCPEDCPCVDDGVCAEGEGFVCLDCGDPTQACGAPCESSETCPSPLSCFNAVCWEACLCGGDCGGEGEGAECWCLGPDLECSDGTLIPGGCLRNP